MWGHFFKILTIGLVLWVATPLSAVAQTAEETGALTSESLQRIIDDAATKGLDVVVISTRKAAIAPAGPGAAEDFQAAIGSFRTNFLTLLEQVPQVIPNVVETLIDASTANGGNGLWWAVLVVVLAMGVGIFAEQLFLK